MDNENNVVASLEELCSEKPNPHCKAIQALKEENKNLRKFKDRLEARLVEIQKLTCYASQ